jgi:CDP-paratose 2-epimerase
VRDVLCVHDLVRAFDAVRINRTASAGQVYNVGGGAGNTVSLLELIDRIERRIGYRLEYSLEHRRPGDQLVYLTDYSKLERQTGWKPEIDLEETIELLRKFWEENQRALRGPRPIVAREAAATTQPRGRAA